MVTSSYCTDRLCMEEGPRHLHAPHGKRIPTITDEAFVARVRSALADLHDREDQDEIDVVLHRAEP